jgi:hypothetical protein
MTTVTGFTADRMLAIEAASVVDGDVDGNGNLILTKHDGSTINAGSVKGPAGPQGPPGSLLSTLSSVPILDVGLSNQIRAGRQLSPADFAAIGLNAPLGLWNLSDLSDASGNGRALSNKGAVPFTTGINGGANTAAQFVGSNAQVLYIPDTGANDPFKMKTGSFGSWFRSSKRAQGQAILGKRTPATPGFSWDTYINSTNSYAAWVCFDGTNYITCNGTSDVIDDRWHFCVATFDGGMIRIYVDCVLEYTTIASGVLYATNGPLNIGGDGGDAATAPLGSFSGRIDEAFVTSDVLSDDQIRALYCAKISHTLGFIPTHVTLNVRRRKKGALFAVSDFPTQPLRLYNFSAGSLGDQGSNNQTLTLNAGTGSIVPASAADGSNNNAYIGSGAHAGLSATDTGLPAGIASRSCGFWTKVGLVPTGAYTFLSWGVTSTGELRIDVVSSGVIRSLSNGDSINGIFICDAAWHFIVNVEDNGAIDGVKRKFYIDGRLVGASTVLNTLTLGGASAFRVGALQTGGNPLPGSMDGVFVCDYALTPATIAQLYAKGSQALSPSPKNVGDHVEGMDATNLYATFDSLESQHQIDLAVA